MTKPKQTKSNVNHLVNSLVDTYLNNNDNWVTTDAITQEILDSAEFNNLISDKFTLRKVLGEAIAYRTRHCIKQRKDETGHPLFANLSYEDENGTVTHIYKRKDKADAEDALKLRQYWIQKTVDARNNAVYWDRVYSEKTGKQLKLPFDENSFTDD